MTLVWRETADRAEAKVGKLGSLLVQKVNVRQRRLLDTSANAHLDYKVIVLGMPLYRNAATLEEGKERAVVAARLWVTDAAKRLLSPDEIT